MRVYRYGCLKPTAGFATVLDQLRLGRRYQNALIELHKWRLLAEASGVDPVRTKQLWAEGSRWLRSRCGLGWGTYQAIEADVQAAIRKTLWWERRSMARWIEGYALDDTPRTQFHRHDGTGRLGATVQACSGITTDDVANSTSVQLLASTGKATVRLRLIGNEWVELPVKVHRPLPLACKLVRALLVVERVGTRYVYSVHFVVQYDGLPRVFGEGSCAINFGWRKRPHGIRVAYVDDHHELVLPHALIEKFKHAEKLRSRADDAAADYLGDAKLRSRKRRDILRNAAPAGRSLGTQQAPYVSDEHWARRDRHFYQWERDEYAKALRQRREIFRLWVRSLARDFGACSIEDFSLARLVKRDPLAAIDIPPARHVRFLVAPGALRAEVKAVFGERAQLAAVKKRTTVCHACGNECVWDKARALWHKCEHCGAAWDQDENNTAGQMADVAAE